MINKSNMNKFVKIILISIVLLIILLVILLVVYFNIKDKLMAESVKNNYDEIEKLEIRQDIGPLDSYNQYFSILKCINKYYATQNVNIEYHIEDIKMQEGEKISKYYIKGMNKEIGTTYLIYYLDNYNATYSILPIDAETYDKVIQYGQEKDDDEIQTNNNNQYEVVTVNDGIIVKKLWEDYQYKVENDIQNAYNNLDKEYREKKFDNIEDYKKYIDNLNIKNIELKKYQKRDNDKYTEYTGIDSNGRCYIFRETAVMQYSVILDSYTIDLPEFLEKYNKSNDEVKIGMNIQKIFDAINDGDYRYVYGKLDNTFKTNNFKTEVEFENYIKTNFYTKNTVRYNRYQKNGNVYAYNITITDTSNTDQKGIEKTIIMLLKEGTDFVMSFNIK